MRLGTFTANIIVDGKALEEYDIVFESPTKVTCWVASEEGKPFSVQWTCHEESRVSAAGGWVSVDGIGCGGMRTSPGILGVGNTSILSSWIDDKSTRDLMFARVQLCDDDSLLEKVINKNLGEISLVIYRGEFIMRRRPDHGSGEKKNLSLPGDSERLHERSKKGTDHCIGFGPAKARTPQTYLPFLVCNGQPGITFVFKYRPLGILQANGIAPRPTANIADVVYANGSSGRVDTPVDHVVEDIKPAELNDRIQSLENELKRLRDMQAGDSVDRKPKRIKTEDAAERGRRFTSGEIIDLT